MSAMPLPLSLPLRIGVAGLGRAFTLMLPTFAQDPRVRLVAACDPLPAARAQFERDFAAPTCDTVQALCAMPDVDVIYVATPHQIHAEHVCLAAAHSKHVLVEKPMAIDLAECDAMIAAAAQARTHIIVGHSHSFNAPVQRAAALLRGGSLGAVRMIHTLNYTDFLYRPRRPEELDTARGGGVVFSQAAHQVDVVRLLVGAAGSPRVTSVRAFTGNWDAQRPTEGAYSALLGFEGGAFASLTYSGYAHFDSDALMGWRSELGLPKDPQGYGQARKRLATLAHGDEEASLKAARNYGGSLYEPPAQTSTAGHQHFGHVIVSCEGGDLRLQPDGLELYTDGSRSVVPLPADTVPRQEVIDELVSTVVLGHAPVHDGAWSRESLQVCLAMLESARKRRDIIIG